MNRINKIKKMNLQKLEQENLDRISGVDEGENPYSNQIRLAEQAGLIFADYNEDGEPEFIGTVSHWNKFNELNK